MTLESWTIRSGGNFDVIVDDSGHSNLQMIRSFEYLFHKALKPGGVYFMEDFVASQYFQSRLGYNDGPILSVDKVTSWIKGLMMSERAIDAQVTRDIKGVQSAHGFRGMCAFFKCPAVLKPGTRCP